MILRPVNLTTGPVQVSKKALKALNNPPISHRSNEFKRLFNRTSELLCRNYSVSHAFIMSGSGTMANEVMLQQIGILNSKGLILSNGEFGSRLIQQAERNALDFEKYEVEWGESLDTKEIERKLSIKDITWVLFCHCETSTGVLNDLDTVAKLCRSYNCLCFVDCMSTVGTIPIDFSNVAMATASSGKGLASFPGLAILFSNIEPLSGGLCPMYLDVSYYVEKNHIPFTISSNLVSALYHATIEKTLGHQQQLIEEYSEKFFKLFSTYGLVPFSKIPSKVFTLLFPEQMSIEFINQMAKSHVLLSYESDYLKKRSWTQLAVFGCYEEMELSHASASLNKCLHHLFK